MKPPKESKKTLDAMTDIGEDIELVTYDDLAKVLAADTIIFLFLVARDGAHGAGWSDIYTSANDQEFGLTYSGDTDEVIDTTNPKEKKVKKTKWKHYEPPVI